MVSGSETASPVSFDSNLSRSLIESVGLIECREKRVRCSR